MLFMGGTMYGTGWSVGDFGHMRGFGHHQMWGYGLASGLWGPWLGILAGIAVLAGATMLYARPNQTRIWGVLVLIASGLNLFVGMGGILASTLGIVGGALALTWHPPV